MKARQTLLLAWIVTGGFTVAGSILGNVFGGGPFAVFGGALAGGVAGVVASVSVALRLTWLAGCALVGAGLLFGASFAGRA